MGRRIEKRVTEREDGKHQTRTNRYLYDNEDILLETDATGKITNRYLHGPGIDEPLALIQGKYTYYYHADGLGSIVALTDSKGKVAQEYQYDSFGNMHDLSNRIKQPYTYTGRELDRETGLYFYRARYYDAQVGRFISEDPIGFAGGVNQFTYTGQNPINRTDPYGLAYFAKRPLQNSPWLGIFSCNPLDDYLNTELSHEQLFFEDGKSPQNVGFFDDGTLKTETWPSGYRCRSAKYDDCIIRKAVQNVPLLPYNLLGRGPGKKHNCQDWGAAVRMEYNRLSSDPKTKCECQK